MATLHRARPTMGLQHELYRRSHRTVPVGEVHPEMLLDMLSMECQRRKLETSLPLDTEADQDLDSIVNDFKIDDSISACFADIASDSGKGKKCKRGKASSVKEISADSLDSKIIAFTGSSDAHSKESGKRNSVVHEHRFRLPTAMKIKLKCSKKFKRHQNEVEKTPYSPIHEQPEEESVPASEVPSPGKSGLVNKTLLNNKHILENRKVIVNQQTPVKEQSGNSQGSQSFSSSSSTSDSELTNHSQTSELTNPQGAFKSNPTQPCGEGHAMSEYIPESRPSHPCRSGPLDAIPEEQVCRNVKEEDAVALPPVDEISDLLNRLETKTCNQKDTVERLLLTDGIKTWRDEAGNNVFHRCILADNEQAMSAIATSLTHLTSEANDVGALPIDTAVQEGHLKCLQKYIDLSHNNDLGEMTLTKDDLERLITVSIVGDQPYSLALLLVEFRTISEERTFSVDKGDNSPGHVAAQLGRIHCLYLLYANEFDLTAANSYGLRPAHVAYEHGHQLCFRFLVQIESEIKLVEQIVGRACIIDKLESSISRCRQQIENDIHRINQHLSQWDETEQEKRTEFAAQVAAFREEVELLWSHNSHDKLLPLLESLQGFCHPDSIEFRNGLRHTLRRIMATVTELDTLRHEAQTTHESEVEIDERNVIIRSIQSSVEQSIVGDSSHRVWSINRQNSADSSQLTGDFRPIHHQALRHGTRLSSLSNSAAASSTVLSSHTHLDADDESMTSYASVSFGEQLPPDFRYEDSRLKGDNHHRTPRTNSKSSYVDSRLSDDTSESDWSSSESSAASSSRKWARFESGGFRERPSKMVYGMLLPDANTRLSTSSSSYSRRRRRQSRHGASRQKRRLSLWDLRELRARKSKSRRLNVANEELPDDILREHRIQQHVKDMKGGSAVKTDLIETITTASGEVYTEELDKRYDPSFPIKLSKNYNSCRGKMIRFSSDMDSNRLPLHTSVPCANHHGDNPQGSNTTCNNKHKVNILGMITKLTKRTKKTKSADHLRSSSHAERKSSDKRVREYTRSEFVERYKPRSLARADDGDSPKKDSSRV